MFEALPLLGNFAAFAIAAAAVWLAGTRIAGYADEIAERTGIGRALLGLALLGGLTSLPELAVASTAAISGEPALSVNDVLGSAAINMLIIALADAAIGRDAITSVTASPRVLLQGVLATALLTLTAAATFAPDRPLLGASAWSWTLLFACVACLAIVAKARPDKAWEAKGVRRKPREDHGEPRELRALVPRTVAAGAAIGAAGFVLAKSGEAIAQQTGLGTSFVGVVLLAASTSLPEVSTVLAVVRLGRYEMALSEVFGTNIFNVCILFVVDLLYDGPPALREAGAFAGFAAIVASVLSAVFVAGMVERRDRTVLRMGVDSLAAIGLYGAGLVVLYQLR
jgi:cation:H+ antiporter